MVMKKIVLLMFSALLFIGACKDDVAKTGKLKVYMTDAPFPIDKIASIQVDISRIEARQKSADSSKFITLTDQFYSFNLMELNNGITKTLSEIDVPVGEYDLVRIIVDKAVVTLKDSSVYDLKVPSGSQTGIKVFISPNIEVVENLSAELLLDFDISKSFVVKGSNDDIKGFNFKPVIKATNLSSAGSVKGIVTYNSSGLEGVTVSLLQNDSTMASTFTDSLGNYKLIGVLAGTYDITLEKDSFSTISESGINVVKANVIVSTPFLGLGIILYNQI
jgi:hypothetical protein